MFSKSHRKNINCISKCLAIVRIANEMKQMNEKNGTAAGVQFYLLEE